MKEDALERAWQALFEGKHKEAKELVIQLRETSFSSLNLQSYLALEEKDYSAAHAFLDEYYDRALAEQDLEHQHIGLHQLAMLAREEEDFQIAKNLLEKEAQIIDNHFPDDGLKKSVNLYERGYLQFKLGHLGLAYKLLKENVALALLTDDLVNRACAYRALGEVLLAKNRRQLAKEHFQIAMDYFEQAENTVALREVETLLTKCNL
ncbi:hypothetical protein C4K46_03505 [Streptococcus oricebi]|uniref:Tetratricopeptide repeat protein n=1 Tax=Streptococcus oricebi TaxID=1547447 RepID=A0ABS5B2H3_9STRE|nr:hypothetical protein [Streptococcus oricebi]